MRTNRILQKAKSIVLIAAAVLISSLAMAQTTGGRNSIGVRLGTDPGVTFKHYTGGNGGVELILHTGYRGLLLTGLYEWHLPFPTAPGLFGYLGVGGHIGFWDHWAHRRYNRGKDEWIWEDGHGPSFGIDGVMGLEYRIPNAPLIIGFDLKPGIDIYRRTPYGTINAAFSFRYRF